MTPPPLRAGRPLRPPVGPSKAASTAARALPYDDFASDGVVTLFELRNANPGTRPSADLQCVHPFETVAGHGTATGGGTEVHPRDPSTTRSRRTSGDVVELRANGDGDAVEQDDETGTLSPATPMNARLDGPRLNRERDGDLHHLRS
ncbi:hypothetical protein BRC90_11070 [Halobacteriales archaeon QS_4_69_34]|nr:MAG: hypothetical protein BRC90_11070 [Halobacteriales archaeon QS_4_69_34]